MGLGMIFYIYRSRFKIHLETLKIIMNILKRVICFILCLCLFCQHVCSCMFVFQLHVMPMEARRGRQELELQMFVSHHFMWVLGFKPESSRRAVGVLNH